MYQFLHHYEGVEEKAAYVLLGRFEHDADRQCTFVEAAILLEGIAFDGEVPLWGGQAWAYIYRQLKREYGKMVIVGWALDYRGQQPSMTDRLEEMHQSNFGGEHQVLLLMDTLEGEEAFYGNRGSHLFRREGFYIYYDRSVSGNRAMGLWEEIGQASAEGVDARASIAEADAWEREKLAEARQKAGEGKKDGPSPAQGDGSFGSQEGILREAAGNRQGKEAVAGEGDSRQMAGKRQDGAGSGYKESGSPKDGESAHGRGESHGERKFAGLRDYGGAGKESWVSGGKGQGGMDLGLTDGDFRLSGPDNREIGKERLGRDPGAMEDSLQKKSGIPGAAEGRPGRDLGRAGDGIREAGQPDDVRLADGEGQGAGQEHPGREPGEASEDSWWKRGGIRKETEERQGREAGLPEDICLADSGSQETGQEHPKRGRGEASEDPWWEKNSLLGAAEERPGGKPGAATEDSWWKRRSTGAREAKRFSGEPSVRRGSDRSQAWERKPKLGEKQQISSYVSSAAMIAAVCMLGASAYLNYRKMNDMEETIARLGGTAQEGQQEAESGAVKVEAVAGNVQREGDTQEAAEESREAGADTFDGDAGGTGQETGGGSQAEAEGQAASDGSQAASGGTAGGQAEASGQAASDTGQTAAGQEVGSGSQAAGSGGQAEAAGQTASDTGQAEAAGQASDTGQTAAGQASDTGQTAAGQASGTGQASDTGQTASQATSGGSQASSADAGQGSTGTAGSQAAADGAGEDAAGEAGQAQAAAEAQNYLEQGYYIVQKGDSLVGICKKIYQTTAMMDKLCEENGIEDRDAIYAGQYLKLP